MSTIRALLTSTSIALSGVALVGAASCADEGITHIAPRTTPKDHKDAGSSKPSKPRDDADDDDEMTVDPSTSDDDEGDDEVGDDDVGDDDVGDDDAADDDAGDDDVGGGDDDEPMASRDAGAGKSDSGKPSADSGDGDDELPACPSGYMCMDPAGPLMAMGLTGTITDQDGKLVAASCSKGGQEMCDPKDPKKSCPNFTNPFCAHVKLTGAIAIELDQCAQKCTP